MVMTNTNDIGGQLENLRAKVTRANALSWIAVVVAFTGGAYANHLLVLSTDIVDGEVKSVDLATSAVTTSKIAASAVTGAKIATNAVTGAKIAAGAVTSAKIADNAVTTSKVADGTLTGADINESTLQGVNANTLNGSTNTDLSGLGEAPALNLVQGLPDCSPGLDYMVRTITVPKDGWVVVNSLFTADGAFGASGAAVAARVEQAGPVFAAGTFGETTVNDGKRANLSMTDRFQVLAGQNTFVLKVCDSSDSVDVGARSTRGKMTFIYSPNLLSSF
jgi:hypothetical protein